jgi:predicted  nucleic acid-binding Zn-ribbon protein
MTIGELHRVLARIEEGQKDLRRELAESRAQMVPMQVYTLEIAALRSESAELKAELVAGRKEQEGAVAGLREELKAEAKQRVLDRRWWLGIVAVPIAGLVQSYLAPLMGVGS